MPDEGSPIHNQQGRTPLRRDSQQWVLDYFIQQTGKAYHFQGDGRGEFPKSVRSHDMISKHLGLEAARLEGIGKNELAAGHRDTALDFFFDAAVGYLRAQHPIFELNDEKKFLYDALRRCYDQVIELSPYRIEHLHIPWNGTTVSGLLHINPNVTGPAPLLFHISGCDVAKEVWPHPRWNHGHQRGMHVFCFDGPGQAEATMRGIKLGPNNYEEAAKAALDHLLTRPEFDPDRVVLYAASFGTIWGMRFAATDPRINAVAASMASIVDKYIHMDLESPRWKQLMAFLTGAESEEELDQIMSEMTMDGYMERITAPTLFTAGEYDPRTPLEEMYKLFDQMTAPAELWVMADQHHMVSVGDKGGPGWLRGAHAAMVDWLADRLAGKPMANAGEVVYINANQGVSNPKSLKKRRWFQ